MDMIATTQGLGPFYPKIVFAGVVYIFQRQYDNEDEAQNFAQQQLDDLIIRHGNLLLVGEGWQR